MSKDFPDPPTSQAVWQPGHIAESLPAGRQGLSE